MPKKFMVIVLLVIFGLGTAAGAGGSYYFWKQGQEQKKQTEEKQKKIEELEKKNKELEGQKKIMETDEYADWLTYTNNDVGYKLKYPQGWTVDETNTTSEVTGQPIKYIMIRTPDKKYFLQLGLKKATDTFAITDRTGIGAGDFVRAGTLTVLGTPIKIEKLVFQNRVKEYFYPGTSPATTSDGRFQFLASFGFNYEIFKYETVDMSNLAEEQLAEKILRSVEIISQ